MSSKDIEFMNYTLGDVHVIELLLSLRYKYDDYLFMRGESALLAVNGVVPLNEEMLLTYASLDQYIENCKFDNVQLNMIKMLEYGYTQDEIAEENGLLPSIIARRLATIYRAIKRENDRQWRRSTYTEALELKTKMCSKCREELPGTPEFYSDLTHSKDGFHSQCKRCRS